jgi:hypothetical protein
MATAVVKRPISQQPAPGVMPPPPPAVVTANENPRPPPIPPVAAQGVPSNESGSADYSHYNSKLTIENFDLLKVSYFPNSMTTTYI